jgi:hypothetical protein
MRRSAVLAAIALWVSFAGMVGTREVTAAFGENWGADLSLASDAAPTFASRTPSSGPAAGEPSDPPKFKVSEESDANTFVGWLDWLATIWRAPFGASPH